MGGTHFAGVIRAYKSAEYYDRRRRDHHEDGSPLDVRGRIVLYTAKTLTATTRYGHTRFGAPTMEILRGTSAAEAELRKVGTLIRIRELQHISTDDYNAVGCHNYIGIVNTRIQSDEFL
jgi:hypothetical protein